MVFLNGSGGQVGQATRRTVNPVEYGYAYDAPHPWQSYSLNAIAPAGTTQIRVEFSSNESSVAGKTGTATGSVWFENAVLSELVSMPVLAPATTLPFTVHDYVPPTSLTNHIEGIAVNSSGIYTLDLVGTMGVSYYVQTATNLLSPLVWEAVDGSTNTVSNTNGLWSYTGTNSSPQLFFRSKVATP